MKHSQIIYFFVFAFLLMGCTNQPEEKDFWTEKHKLPEIRQIQNRLTVLLDKYKLTPRFLRDTTDVYTMLDAHKAKYPGKVKVSSVNNTQREREKPDWREEYMCNVFVSDDIILLASRKMWALEIYHEGVTENDFGLVEYWLFTSSGWSVYGVRADKAIWKGRDYYVTRNKKVKNSGFEDDDAAYYKGRKFVRQFKRLRSQRVRPKNN